MQPKFKRPVQIYLAATAVLADAFTDGDSESIQSALDARESALAELKTAPVSDSERLALAEAEDRCRVALEKARAGVIGDLNQFAKGRSMATTYATVGSNAVWEING
ncbi:hypothetical protein QPK87_37150 [Kamptonema cortianum]|nr:hypothetical protein [Geitlerinema splendidum]MDK3162136.1 hypothetical protein [Kamptonema cortianum]